MITREQLANWIDRWDGADTAMVDWPCVIMVDGVRWIHVTTGSQLIATKSGEECSALPSRNHDDRRKTLRKWLGPIPVNCIGIKLEDLRAWHGEPTDSERGMHRTSIGRIDGAPFNRYLVKHALSLIETPLVMAWWSDEGALLFGDAENTWRVAVMPMTPDYFGKPWPTADRPWLVLRASWDRRHPGGQGNG